MSRQELTARQLEQNAVPQKDLQGVPFIALDDSVGKPIARLSCSVTPHAAAKVEGKQLIKNYSNLLKKDIQLPKFESQLSLKQLPKTGKNMKSTTEEEMRQTWKFKPKISNKLPSAFSIVDKL